MRSSPTTACRTGRSPSTKRCASRNKLRQYCKNLLKYEPDYVFTHVTRLVPSKGLWRDLRVLEHLEHDAAQAQRDGGALHAQHRSPRPPAATTSAGWSSTTTGRSSTAKACPTSPAARPRITRACRSSTPAVAQHQGRLHQPVRLRPQHLRHAACRRTWSSWTSARARTSSSARASTSRSASPRSSRSASAGSASSPNVCGCAGFVEQGRRRQADAQRRSSPTTPTCRRRACARSSCSPSASRSATRSSTRWPTKVASELIERLPRTPAGVRAVHRPRPRPGQADELGRRRPRYVVPGIQRATQGAAAEADCVTGMFVY